MMRTKWIRLKGVRESNLFPYKGKGNPRKGEIIKHYGFGKYLLLEVADVLYDVDYDECDNIVKEEITFICLIVADGDKNIRDIMKCKETI